MFVSVLFYLVRSFVFFVQNAAHYVSALVFLSFVLIPRLLICSYFSSFPHLFVSLFSSLVLYSLVHFFSYGSLFGSLRRSSAHFLLLWYGLSFYE